MVVCEIELFIDFFVGEKGVGDGNFSCVYVDSFGVNEDVDGCNLVFYKNFERFLEFDLFGMFERLSVCYLYGR